MTRLRFEGRHAAPDYWRTVRRLLLAIGLAGLPAASAHAWILDEQTTVNINGQQKYAGGSELLSFPLFDISPSIPLGAIGCFGVCLGLEAEAGGHAAVDVRFAVSYESTLNLASQANARTFIFGQGAKPSVGDPFFLINRIDPLGIKKLDVKSGDFSAFAGVDLSIGGFARAEACAILCVEAGLKLTVNDLVPLASVDGQGLKVFGSLVDSSAPYGANAPAPFSSFASATANLPTLAKTFSNLATGTPAVMNDKREPVLTLNADVAGLVAKAAGFPIALKGSKYGFGYELLSLDAFAGADLSHDFALNVLGLETVYQFSSPVQVFDDASQAWGAPVSLLELGDNESVQLRSLESASLGISRAYRLKYEADYDYDLILNAGLDLSGLALYGHGLKLGPLLDPDRWKIDLGRFDLDSGATTGAILSFGKTANIAFDPVKLLPAGEGLPPIEVDLCAVLGGCERTGYVTVRDAFGDGIVQETTYRVTNFGVQGCGPDGLLDCDIDATFAPQVRHVRATDVPSEAVTFSPDLLGGDAALLAALQEAGIDLFGMLSLANFAEYASDFRQLDAFLNAPSLEQGPQSNDAMLLAALRAQGVDLDNPFPRTPIDPGVPYGTLIAENQAFAASLAVPEPSTYALLALGGIALCLARRRRHSRETAHSVSA